MPYTPPAQQSPASSKPNSPSLSRSPSHHEQISSPSPTGPRPGLPRSLSSTAYMQKHRRSPSISKSSASSSTENTAMNANMDRSDAGQCSNSSVRQSPPPVTDAAMPSGALVSPPDSTQGSDDESSSYRGRHIENLAELHEAVRRSIDPRKEGSPPDNSYHSDLLRGLALATPPLSRGKLENRSAESWPALTPEARKISHSRSSSENVFQLGGAANKQADSSGPSSDSEDDEEGKPPLLRKKSGELVKPALRPPSRRRPSSMPGTPTYSKAVHFNEDIEQVRHFLQVDRPIAVSAGTSPVETYDSETEYPFGNGESRTRRSVEWEIRQTNFPSDTKTRDYSPVKLERLFLSSDSQTLIGTVGVTNLAFHKMVVARFTLDYWKTTSEVVAEYDNDVRKQHTSDGRDRFNFNIKLTDQAHLENKTLLLCIRYNVNGQEFWDNNNHMNFQVDFIRKSKQHEKGATQGLGSRPLHGIPRSKGSPPATTRPRSMPASLDDDFTSGFDSKYRFGSNGSLQDSPSSTIRLKSKPKNPRASVSNETAHGANAAFGTRYDFSASLSAALSNAQTALGESSGLKMKPKKPSTSHYFSDRAPSEPANTSSTAPSQRSPGLEALSTEKPPQNSEAYNELIQKYCFFGSSKTSSPQATAKPSQTAQNATADANEPVSESSLPGSGSNTPPQPAVDGTNERKPHTRTAGALMPRSGSPTPMAGSAMNSRAASPSPFGYPYRRGMDAEFHQPTAIHS